MSDPNWFYSALAQSAAAIVGLFGAFVTSRVIWMAGERSQIERRINETTTEVQQLEQENVPLLEYIEEVDKRYEEEDRKEDEETVNYFLQTKKRELDLEKLPTADEMLEELKDKIRILDEKIISMFDEKYAALVNEKRREKEETPPKTFSSLGIFTKQLAADIQLPKLSGFFRSPPDPDYVKFKGVHYAFLKARYA